MRKVREMAFDIADARARAHHYHSAIFEQVRAGNREGARQSMREHLYEAETTLQRALALHALRAYDDAPEA
jgi:DNA-binding FadR family transcriptional regulator